MTPDTARGHNRGWLAHHAARPWIAVLVADVVVTAFPTTFWAVFYLGALVWALSGVLSFARHGRHCRFCRDPHGPIPDMPGHRLWALSTAHRMLSARWVVLAVVFILVGGVVGAVTGFQFGFHLTVADVGYAYVAVMYYAMSVHVTYRPWCPHCPQRGGNTLPLPGGP